MPPFFVVILSFLTADTIVFTMLPAFFRMILALLTADTIVFTTILVSLNENTIVVIIILAFLSVYPVVFTMTPIVFVVIYFFVQYTFRFLYNDSGSPECTYRCFGSGS